MSLTPRYIIPPLTAEEHKLLILVYELPDPREFFSEEDQVKVQALLDKISRPKIKQ